MQGGLTITVTARQAHAGKRAIGPKPKSHFSSSIQLNSVYSCKSHILHYDVYCIFFHLFLYIVITECNPHEIVEVQIVCAAVANICPLASIHQASQS